MEFKSIAILLLAGLAVLRSSPAEAQVLNEVHFNAANGHHYQLILFPARTWEQARVAAEGMAYHGVQGHLVNSPEEEAFLQSWIGRFFIGRFWLGGFQPAGSLEPDGNWQWVTGEPFTYTNWLSPSEPNNAWNEENRIEAFDSNLHWNDLGDLEGSPFPSGRPNTRSYLVEFPTPELSAALLLGVGLPCVVATSRSRLTRQPERGYSY